MLRFELNTLKTDTVLSLQIHYRIRFSLLCPVFRSLHFHDFHENPEILLAERFVDTSATSSQLTIDAKREN